MLTSDFDYLLPETAIAQSAIEPRDSSRLLRVSTMTDHRFTELPDLLAPGDLLLVNRTRVRHARLVGVRPDTGGSVELLLLRRRTAGRWEALAKPARRLRPGVAINCGPIEASVVSPPAGGVVEVELTADQPIEEAIQVAGTMPLPPYFHGQLDDPERYQTIFATVTGSAAAPTAALHFTRRLEGALIDRAIEIAEVELEVGLDTFRPMTVDRLDDHVMHEERYAIPEATATAVAGAQSEGRRVIAVGTTVLRALETAASADGRVTAGPGTSALFIVPGYSPRVVDALLTNFHAPRTTLIALVAALLGDSWREVYRTALARGYRFLSFGDAMLIEGLRSEPA